MWLWGVSSSPFYSSRGESRNPKTVAKLPSFHGSQNDGTFTPSDSRACVTSLSSFLSHTLPTKVDIVKAMVFPVVLYGFESWAIKKAKCQKIDAFELWSWRILLRVPRTARRSNQSILKEISPECSLEGLMLKLKLQYFGHLK